MKLNKFINFPWYTLFLALYSPLALLAYNLGQVDISATIRSLLISLGITLVLLTLLNILLKDLQKAGLIVALITVLFFSYGHIYLSIKNFQIGGFLIGRHRYLAVFWLGLAGVGIWWILTKLRSTAFTGSLNLIALLLVLFPVTQIAFFEMENMGNEPSPLREHQQKNTPADENLPDVYYIILDAYGRSDVLQKDLDYDNSSFLEDLEKLGFYVAKCSQSNYANTELSLASSLNLDYLNVLDEELIPETTDRTLVRPLVKHNLVVEKFMSLGYTVRTFDTEFNISDIEPVDYFYEAPQRGFNGFEGLLLQTTAGVILDDAGFFRRFHITVDDLKYNRILFTLDTLEEIPQLSGPDFVFVHFIIPHPRFVFGPDGEMAVVQKFSTNKAEYYSDENYIKGYKNQAIFISDRITEVAENIIQNSSNPPIIIIQGDHGPNHFSEEDRMGILNAYYFPEVEKEFYPTITPVNSFRLLFSTYFGEDYPLLDDLSYYSTYQNPYQFEEIPNECE